MNEEEIIKYVNEIIKDSQNEIKGKDYFEYIMTPNDIKAIQGLLDLYNKGKEKNEKYQEVISNLNKNWISKEYLKTKLNNLKEKEQELSDEQGYWGGTKLQDKIEFYEELLEERN